MSGLLGPKPPAAPKGPRLDLLPRPGDSAEELNQGANTRKRRRKGRKTFAGELQTSAPVQKQTLGGN